MWKRIVAREILIITGLALLCLLYVCGTWAIVYPWEMKPVLVSAALFIFIVYVIMWHIRAVAWAWRVHTMSVP